jgi:hypothetical protein
MYDDYYDSNYIENLAIEDEENDMLNEFVSKFKNRILDTVETKAKEKFGVICDEIKSFKEDKKAFNQEMEKIKKDLQKEKYELGDERRKYEKAEAEFEKKEKQLESKFAKELSEAAKNQFVDYVFSKIPKQYYHVVEDRKRGPKCDKCDDDRMVVAVDQFGREHKVECQCDKYIYKYTVESKQVTQFDQRIEYERYSKNYTYECSIGFGWGNPKADMMEDLFYDDLSCDEIEKKRLKSRDYISCSKIYFKTKEKAEEYAKYLEGEN